MKLFYAAIFLVLIILSFVAWGLTPADEAGDRTVIVWATDNNPVREGQVALFNKLNPDLFLKIDPANTGQEKVIVQSLAGVGPDVFDSFGQASLEAYVRSGIAGDVTEDLRAAGVDIERDVWPVAHTSFIFEGRAYGFPCNVNANAIWYNKTLFDEAGVTYPRPGWTWDEFIETAQKLTKRDAEGKPIQFGAYLDPGTASDMMAMFGGRRFTPDGSKCIIDSDEAKAGFQLYHDMLYKHRISPTPIEEASLATAGGWGSGGITFLMGGKVAMAYGGRWWLNRMRTWEERNLGAVLMPYARDRVQFGGARSALLNKHSKNRAAAVRFIKFLASDAYNELVNDQADAIAPLKRVSYGERFLRNPEFPEEDYNEVWREAVAKAIPDEISPFVRGADLVVLNGQIDLIRSNLKPVNEALDTAARDTNERILRNAQLRPHLRDLFVELTGVRP